MLLDLERGARAVGWIAWYRGHAVSAHADLRVLAALMAAEGLGDAVRYTRAEDGEPNGLAAGGSARPEPGELALAGVAGPDALDGCGSG